MPNTRWKEILEGVGLIAVVASLIFVALQIRQSNQIGRLEAMQSMASDWASVGLEISASESLSALLARIYDGAEPADFDAAENIRLRILLHGLDHFWEMRFKQLNLGVLEPGDYSFPRFRNHPVFGSAYHKAIWPEIRPGFSEDFAIFWEQRFDLAEDKAPGYATVKQA